MHISRRYIATLFLVLPISAICAPDHGGGLADEELRRIDAYLQDYYRDVLVTKRISGEQGEIISCVDIRHQPGLKGGIELQLEPSPQLKALLDDRVTQPPPSALCPAGSVEMRLPTRENIAAEGGLERFLGRGPAGSPRKASPPPLAPTSEGVMAEGHYWAAVGQERINALGAQSTFNLWKPQVPAVSNPDAYPLFSLSQVWVNGGGLMGGSGPLQSIEAGTHVFQQAYKETTNLHFFIYWTADGYDRTGCYNLKCTGFVVTSGILPIGGVLPSSTTGGTQLEGTIAWYRDPATGNWMLLLHDAVNGYQQVGFYPRQVFQSGQLSRSATRVAFGGEIYAPQQDAPTIPMGSGVNPLKSTSQGYGSVMYQRNLKWMDTASVIRDLQPTSITLEPPSIGCAYAARFHPPHAPYRSDWGSSLFIGGTGFGPGCPRL